MKFQSNYMQRIVIQATLSKSKRAQKDSKRDRVPPMKKDVRYSAVFKSYNVQRFT